MHRVYDSLDLLCKRWLTFVRNTLQSLLSELIRARKRTRMVYPVGQLHTLDSTCAFSELTGNCGKDADMSVNTISDLTDPNETTSASSRKQVDRR